MAWVIINGEKVLQGPAMSLFECAVCRILRQVGEKPCAVCGTMPPALPGDNAKPRELFGNGAKDYFTTMNLMKE